MQTIIICILSTILVYSNVSFAKQSNSAKPFPNLSVEIPEEDKLSSWPLRSAREFYFEKNIELFNLNHLDELERDLLYIKNLKTQTTTVLKNDLPQTIDLPKIRTIKSNKVLLFFDLNFAPAEIRAAQEAAAIRGEQLLIFPARTEEQQAQIESTFLEIVRLKSDLESCRSQSTSDCTPIQNKIKEKETVLSNLLDKLKEVDNLIEIFSYVREHNLIPTSIILSGHSAGTDGHIWGGKGRVEADDLKNAFASFPELKDQLNSILLWGCYTGTLGAFTEVWQKTAPEVKVFFGYRNRAPLGIRPASGRLLKSYLINESTFLQKNSPEEMHAFFKTFDLVADLDGTALKDNYYISYEQIATYSDLVKKCGDFDLKLLDSFKCYESADKGCETPPENHLGPLRDLYTFMQVNRHCKDLLRSRYIYLPPTDQVVKLIYMDNIKVNLFTHLKGELEVYKEHLHNLSYPEGYRPQDYYFENYLNSRRSDDLKRQNLLDNVLHFSGSYDSTYVENEKWKSIYTAEYVSTRINTILYDGRTPSWACAPITWVELGATEKDTCGFGAYLRTPLDSESNRFLQFAFFLNKFLNWTSNNTSPTMLEVLKGYFDFELETLKTDYQETLEFLIKSLEENQFNNSYAIKRMNFYKDLLHKSQKRTPRQIAVLLKRELASVDAKLDEVLLAAKDSTDYDFMYDFYFKDAKVKLKTAKENLQRLSL